MRVDLSIASLGDLESRDIMSSAQISVVMPVYNAMATLPRSIDSVLAQTFLAFELVVVDDGSTDGSAALIETYARRDSRVRAIYQANRGVAEARNVGINASNGSHIAFLDSDDWWAPRKLELQFSEMRRRNIVVSYMSYQRVDENGRNLSRVIPPARVTYADLLKSNHIGNLTGMYNRKIGDGKFLRIGHEDYVFWLERVKRSGVAVCVPCDEPLAFYLVRKNSLSSGKLRAIGWQWEIYRKIEGVSIPNSCWLLVQYLFRAILKRGFRL
jgi:teichuronic acid biosynthesis glycosyltransferase TuaG